MAALHFVRSNQPIDYVSLAKQIVRDMRILVSDPGPNDIKIKAIIQSIAKIKIYINLDDDADNDEKMERYIEYLDSLVNELNNDSVTPIDEPETPDEPEIVQYSSQ